MWKSTIVGFAIAAAVAVSPSHAVDFQHTSSDEWIAKWYSMENVMNTGGFAISGGIDYFSEGSGGDITHEIISTTKGLGVLDRTEIVLDDAHSGLGMGEDGVWDWEVIDINVDDSRNMSSSWGLVDQSDFTWHGIIVLKAPSARSTTMHPAHDDYAQIWINGEQVYDNDQWTGGVKTVTQPTEVDLVQGDNVLLFKCGEAGGDDYVNLHFEDGDSDLDIVPTLDGEFLRYAGLAVEAQGKVSTTWGALKAR
jgi:hypothetical protein